jgi:Zn-dependent protease
MSFGTKRSGSSLKPLVLATQNSLHVPASKPDQDAATVDLIAGSRARYFANASAFASTSALPRRKQPSEISETVVVLLSALAVAMCVFGVFYWLTGGTLKLSDL